MDGSYGFGSGFESLVVQKMVWISRFLISFRKGLNRLKFVANEFICEFLESLFYSEQVFDYRNFQTNMNNANSFHKNIFHEKWLLPSERRMVCEYCCQPGS